MNAASTLQQEARQTIQEALRPFGYETPHLRFGWQVPNADEVRRYTSQDRGEPDKFPTGRARFLDALVFADDRKQDWHTSAIAIDLNQDKAVGTEASRDQARQLFHLTAAPTNLVGSLARKKVDVWFNCHDGIVGVRSIDLAPEPLRAAFQSHRSSVERDLLAHLRSGQRHFFDGQLHARRNELASFLQRGVSKATWVVGNDPWAPTNDEEPAMREAFSRVALALLAARILEDKGALGDGREQSTNARQLLAEAKAKWDSFFDTVQEDDLARLDAWFRPDRVNLMLHCLLSHLTGPVNFALVTHEMLGDLYERALVAERSIRSETLIDLRGVHYTPLAIARRILDRIPLEDLPVPHRTVCDFACGSGSFLLAATDRLATLFDPREPDAIKDRTAWLGQAVMGNDIDPVAILVAKLSYLVAYWNRIDEMKSVPFPNLHEGADALTLDLGKTFGRVPKVIVGNPPFDLKGHPASEFLDRALTILRREAKEYPGYLGMVMPGAFLKGHTGQETVRTKLLKQTRILEIWELPEHAVGLCADTPTCVVIAQVSGETSPAELSVRTCQTISRRNEAVSALRDAGITTWSYVAAVRPSADTKGDISQDTLALSPVDDIWSRLVAQGPVVRDIAEAGWGFTHTKAQGDPDPEFSPTATPGFVPCIRLQSALRPYNLTEGDWLASQPDDNRFWKKGSGRRPAQQNWPYFEAPKILISAQSNRNAISQLVAALDIAKYYPGKHFLALTLLSHWESPFQLAYPALKATSSVEAILRWLCAILNSPFGHAWFAKHAGPRGPQADVCLTMPLPAEYDPAIAQQVAHLEVLPRPANLDDVPTWNPLAGMVTLAEDLFGDAAAAQTTNTYWQVVEAINTRVLASYGLSNSERERFTAFINGMVEPWTEYPPEAAQIDSTTILRVLRGKTLSVNPLAQTMEVELLWRALGNGNAVSIPIPKFMPGWALQAERAFTCLAPAKATLETVRANPWLLRDFAALPYSYLPNEKLEEMIGFRTGATAT
jgi:N-6 DNA Methylase